MLSNNVLYCLPTIQEGYRIFLNNLYHLQNINDKVSILLPFERALKNDILTVLLVTKLIIDIEAICNITEYT